MLFVTVGTQLPFDRMIRVIDEWAGHTGRADVFAQIGPSEYRPKHLQWERFIPADVCRHKIEEADLILAHAGMGSILTALELGKKIIVMPRRADLREHRNDHQIATARRLLAQGRVAVAFDEVELRQKLEQLDQLHAAQPISPQASPMLLHAIQAFVRGEDVVGRLRQSIGSALARMGDRPLQGDLAAKVDESAAKAGNPQPIVSPQPQKVSV